VKEERTLEHQCTELAKIREWLVHKVRAESNENLHYCFFEAQHAIGFALLQLQRAELSIGRNESFDG
jgi:hypothetical protein